MSFQIRPYQPTDLDAVYQICLKTGNAGEDASSLHDDPLALGHLYAGPYVTLEPQLAFVLEDADGVCGYIVGALDSHDFRQRLAEEWLPRVRQQVPDPGGDPERWSADERLYHEIHHPGGGPSGSLDPYPSHLHIDLLPRGQGRGNGRRLMETLLSSLREAGSPGVHLGVAARNARAVAFYRKTGFGELFRTGAGQDLAITMVQDLR